MSTRPICYTGCRQNIVDLPYAYDRIHLHPDFLKFFKITLIIVCTSIRGCLLGYQQLLQFFKKKQNNYGHNSARYRQFYYLHQSCSDFRKQKKNKKKIRTYFVKFWKRLQDRSVMWTITSFISWGEVSNTWNILLMLKVFIQPEKRSVINPQRACVRGL